MEWGAFVKKTAVLFLFVLVVFSLPLCAISLKYEYYLERVFVPEIRLYFASVSGTHFQYPSVDDAGSSTEISLDMAYTDPQLLVGFQNNLEVAGNYRIKLTFNQFRKVGDSSTRCSYYAYMCRYKTTTLQDGTKYYAEPADLASFDLTDYHNLEYKDNNYRDKTVNVTGDNKSTDWGINASNADGEIRTWYYAITFLFVGNCPGSGGVTGCNYKANFDPEASYEATIKVELTGQ